MSSEHTPNDALDRALMAIVTTSPKRYGKAEQDALMPGPKNPQAVDLAPTEDVPLGGNHLEKVGDSGVKKVIELSRSHPLLDLLFRADAPHMVLTAALERDLGLKQGQVKIFATAAKGAPRVGLRFKTPDELHIVISPQAHKQLALAALEKLTHPETAEVMLRTERPLADALQDSRLPVADSVRSIVRNADFRHGDEELAGLIERITVGGNYELGTFLQNVDMALPAKEPQRQRPALGGTSGPGNIRTP